MALRAIAFDLDNTLVDRDSAIRAWLEAFVGRRLDPGRRAEAIAALLHLDAGGDLDRAAFCRALSAESGGRIDPAAIWEEYQRDMPRLIAPAPDARALLCTLGKRYRVAILTNGSSRIQRAKLAAAGLAGAAGAVFVSGEVGADKPDPRAFAPVLAWAGCRPGEFLFVGDHPRCDVAGARAAGLATCWIARGRPWPAPAPPPDFCLERALDLGELLY